MSRRLLLAAPGLLALAHPAASAPLTWSPPVLNDPVTVIVSNTNRSLKLQAGVDYLIVMPQKISVSNGLTVNGQGARNIVFIGGEIDVPNAGTYVNSGDFGNKRRALMLQNWTGTCHAEGLWLHGADLAEGIDVDARVEGAVLQLANIRVDDVHSRPEEIAVNWSGTHHPDIVQNWGGPSTYRIDGLTGYSDYQGLFMQPDAYGFLTVLADFRNVDLHATNASAGGAYMLYKAGTVNAFNLPSVYVEPRAAQAWRGGAYPEGLAAWTALSLGSPAGGNFVASGTAGMTYVTPGYANGVKLTLVHQSESLVVGGSSGDPHSIIANYIFTNGNGTYYEANQVGDYVTYKLPYLQARSYNIRVGSKAGSNTAIFQAAIADTIGGTYVNCGSPNDPYGTSPAALEFDLGTVTPATAGSKMLRFQATGRNVNSNNYKMNFDYIKLIPQ